MNENEVMPEAVDPKPISCDETPECLSNKIKELEAKLNTTDDPVLKDKYKSEISDLNCKISKYKSDNVSVNLANEKKSADDLINEMDEASFDEFRRIADADGSEKAIEYLTPKFGDEDSKKIVELYMSKSNFSKKDEEIVEDPVSVPQIENPDPTLPPTNIKDGNDDKVIEQDPKLEEHDSKPGDEASDTTGAQVAMNKNNDNLIQMFSKHTNEELGYYVMFSNSANFGAMGFLTKAFPSFIKGGKNVVKGFIKGAKGSVKFLKKDAAKTLKDVKNLPKNTEKVLTKDVSKLVKGDAKKAAAKKAEKAFKQSQKELAKKAEELDAWKKAYHTKVQNQRRGWKLGKRVAVGTLPTLYLGTKGAQAIHNHSRSKSTNFGVIGMLAGWGAKKAFGPGAKTINKAMAKSAAKVVKTFGGSDKAVFKVGKHMLKHGDKYVTAGAVYGGHKIQQKANHSRSKDNLK